MPERRTVIAAIAAALVLSVPLAAQDPPAEPEPSAPPPPEVTAEPAESPESPESDAERELEITFGLEAKAHYRDSEHFRQPSPLVFPPELSCRRASRAVSWRRSTKASTSRCRRSRCSSTPSWGESLVAHAKIDVIDLYDRNPTSSDQKVDVDELWIRFGRDPTAFERAAFGAYLKVGKFEQFERQDDRHLESYGLVSTAFNRFEDPGLELGVDLGRHVYLQGSLTQGNPVFLRDPNALAGDNGTPEAIRACTRIPTRELNSGIPILYDAEVEDLDVDGDLETRRRARAALRRARLRPRARRARLGLPAQAAPTRSS